MRLIVLRSRAEAALVERVLDVPERDWQLRCQAYFSVPHITLRATPRPLPHLADVVWSAGTPPLLTISERWVYFSRGLRRRILTHENLHCAGWPHVGGYRTQIELDTVSPKIEQDILRGAPHFNPERFGLPARPPMIRGAIRFDTERRLR